jgi:hypothetical protein
LVLLPKALGATASVIGMVITGKNLLGPITIVTIVSYVLFFRTIGPDEAKERIPEFRLDFLA